jgi:NAD(P)-dependent dehydrogenase (short-subunit alcohol dehydrogenase family)
VSTPEGAEALVDAARDQWRRLDILVNNAGIDGTPAPLADCTIDDFDRVMAVNLRGPFLTMRAAVPLMTENGGGSVINIGSVLGRVAVGYLPAYCASKGGLVQLTKSAALAYATAGVRVNVISPGVVRTPMLDAFFGQMPEAAEAAVAQHPVGRIGIPDEIAAMAVYLASDEAKFVTGADLVIDGGYTAQ